MFKLFKRLDEEFKQIKAKFQEYVAEKGKELMNEKIAAISLENENEKKKENQVYFTYLYFLES